MTLVVVAFTDVPVRYVAQRLRNGTTRGLPRSGSNTAKCYRIHVSRYVALVLAVGDLGDPAFAA